MIDEFRKREKIGSISFLFIKLIADVLDLGIKFTQTIGKYQRNVPTTNSSLVTCVDEIATIFSEMKDVVGEH